jgi:hypothetical protein
MSNLSETVQHLNPTSKLRSDRVEIGHKSNRWKAVFINGVFIYKISGEVMVKFYQNTDLCRKVKSV